MPGIDVLTQLGTADWVTTDGPRLVRALQRARFDLAGVASRRALSGDIAGGNAEIKALVDANPQTRGWLVINPAYPELSSEEMRRYAAGARWLGAILPSMLCEQGIATDACREVLNAYRRYTKPLLVHVPDEATVHGLEALAREFTTLKFIAAGAGGDHWQDCLLAAKNYVNIFLEPFTGGPHRGKVEAIFQSLGPNRILFASNFPDMNPGASLGLLLEAKISDGEKQHALSSNAMRLFNLRAAEPPAA